MEPIDFDGLAYKIDVAAYKMRRVIEKIHHFNPGYQSGDIDPVAHMAFLNNLLEKSTWASNVLMEIKSRKVPADKCAKTLDAIARLLRDITLVPSDYDQVLEGIV